VSDDAEQPSDANPDHREAGREVKRFAQSLRNGYEISDEYRKASVEACYRILASSKSERNRLNAVKALALLDRLNITADKLTHDIAKSSRIQPAAASEVAAGPVTVEVEFVDDYYGTAAAAEAAEARLAIAATDEASDADPVEPGAGEDSGLRAAVG
jgi:hypothetical protein